MAATSNHGDELALDARILWSLFLDSPIAAELRTGGGRSALAKACGATEGQVFTWLRGEAMPPPHQARVFMAAACDRGRQRRADAAESRASQAGAPPASETTREGAEAARKRLAADFPDWRFPLPDGHESLGTEKIKVVWRARHSGDWPDVYAVSSAELEGKLTGVEAELAARRKEREDARRARGKRSVV